MKVLYDHQIYSSQVYGGISRYFYELINRFVTDEQIDPLLDVRFSNNYYIRNLKIKYPYSFFKNWDFRGKNRILEYLNRIHTYSLLKNTEYDLFHPTFYNPYFLEHLNNKPFVLTVHDLIHEIYPQLPNAASEISDRKKLIETASMIITPSQNTKNDLLKFYDVSEKKVEVIYHGSYKTNKSNEINIKFPKKYFLFVGSRVFYKNFSIVLKSIAAIKKEYKDIHLICAGGGEFSKAEYDLICDLNLESNILQYSFSDAELKTVYAKAIALIFSSQYEGFGIPILEAFSNNCPCILASASCLPEVAGHAALYFDPESTGELSSKMTEVLLDQDLRYDLIEKGKDRNKYFSWEKTAAETIDIYKKVLADSGV